MFSCRCCGSCWLELALFVDVVGRGCWIFELPGMGGAPGRCGSALFSDSSLEANSSCGFQSLMMAIVLRWLLARRWPVFFLPGEAPALTVDEDER